MCSKYRSRALLRLGTNIVIQAVARYGYHRCFNARLSAALKINRRGIDLSAGFTRVSIQQNCAHKQETALSEIRSRAIHPSARVAAVPRIESVRCRACHGIISLWEYMGGDTATSTSYGHLEMALDKSRVSFAGGTPLDLQIALIVR